MAYKKMAKGYKPSEIAESYIFPGPSIGRQEILGEVKEFRQEFKKKQSAKSKLISSLLQLRFIMEDYLMNQDPEVCIRFSEFLKEYMLRIQKNGKELALELNVDPAEVSLVMNNKRKPTEKLIFRLDIHSNHSFPAIQWMQILEKEKIYELSNNNKVMESEARHVTKKIDVAI